MKKRISALILWTMMLILLQCPAASAINGQYPETETNNRIISYTKKTNNGFYETYSAGVVNAPVASVEALLRDVSARPQYVYGCAETTYANIPGLTNTPDVHYIYNRTAMPAFLNDRDCVLKSVWTIDRSSGTIYCRSEGIDTDYRFRANVIRMNKVKMNYTLIPRSSDMTLVVCEAVADPGGNIPNFVVNMFTKSLGSNMIEGIQKMANRPKYQNSRIVTATPSFGSREA